MIKLDDVLAWLKVRQFAIAIVGSIVVALVLTVVSMWVYHINDVSRLDISRPAYEGARKSVDRTDSPSNDFESSGHLDKESLDAFQKEFDSKRKLLDGNSRFDPQVLSDDQLKLSVPESGSAPE